MRQCNTIEHHGIKEEFDYTHLFKTDDDSYFNIDALYTELHTIDEGVDVYYIRA